MEVKKFLINLASVAITIFVFWLMAKLNSYIFVSSHSEYTEYGQSFIRVLFAFASIYIFTQVQISIEKIILEFKGNKNEG